MSSLISLSLLVMSIATGSLAGCSSPRQKDCTVVMPLVEESKRARVGGVMDGGLNQPTFAERPRRTASALRALVLKDPEMKPAVAALADANDRFAAAMTALDKLVSAMKIKPGAPAPLAPNFLDSVQSHAARLMERCGIVLRTEQQRALPDCIALERAFEQCVTPAADNTTAEEQLITCATTVGKVHSGDQAANESIQQIAKTLRDLGPSARNIGAPAKEVIRAVRRHVGEFSKQGAARTEVERTEEAIREMCQRGGGGS